MLQVRSIGGEAAWLGRETFGRPERRLPYIFVLVGLLLSLLLAHEPWMAVGIIVGGGLTTLIVIWPLPMLAALLLIGPIDLSFLTGGYKALFETMGGLDMNGIRLVASVTGFGIVAMTNRESVAVAFGRQGRWYLLFLAWAVATLTYSWSSLDGVRLLLKLAYPFLLFIVVLGALKTRADLDRLGTAIVVGAALTTVLLNPLYLLAGGFVYDVVLGTRVGGVGIYAAPWSFYVLLMLIIAMVRFSTRRQAGYLLLAAVCVFWIVLALSRTALLAGVAALALIGTHSATVNRDYRLLTGAVVLGAALLVAIVPAFLQKTFGHVVPAPAELIALARDPLSLLDRVSLSGREMFWPVIFLYFISSPIMGLGLGTTTYLMETRMPEAAGGVVHNEYLRLATETGLVGLTLFALAIVAWARGVGRASLRREKWVLEWAVPALGGLAVWAVTGFGDNAIDYYAPVSQFVAVLAAGAIWAARHAAAEEAAAARQAAQGEDAGMVVPT